MPQGGAPAAPRLVPAPGGRPGRRRCPPARETAPGLCLRPGGVASSHARRQVLSLGPSRALAFLVAWPTACLVCLHSNDMPLGGKPAVGSHRRFR
ncbi:hypothetical protein ADZ36_20335 [Streptomyces fradiae]|uniref:Uncharacterized protein n=1 Tax=Streptomyces fradiae TaxID=1906 RepID=A0ACC4W891_STRFR|nr:hypothetical protein ADZ36_20335 [Streptomyces fradiae]